MRQLEIWEPIIREFGEELSECFKAGLLVDKVPFERGHG